MDAVPAPLDSAVILIGHQVCLSTPAVCTERINQSYEPRAEADGASVGYCMISRRFVEKTTGSKDLLSSFQGDGLGGSYSNYPLPHHYLWRPVKPTIHPELLVRWLELLRAGGQSRFRPFPWIIC